MNEPCLLNIPPAYSMIAFKPPPREKQFGFTFIELMMGITVLVVLAAISFGVFQGVQNAQFRTQTKAELAVFAQALERYKSKYGDYPWTPAGLDPSNLDPTNEMQVAMENSALLLNALMGWGHFDLSGSTPGFDPNLRGAALIDVSQLTVRQIGSDLEAVDYPADASAVPAGYYLADPMGNPYVYLYGRTTSLSAWENFAYVLYSKGVDGVDSVSGFNLSTGLAEDEQTYRYNVQNADNIYAEE